jgi:alkylation response protein AidB-like acyl-CoA dehydrogenase
MATEPTSVNAVDAPHAAARRIASHAAELAEQIERERTLPADLRAELVDAGLFALCLPRALGGVEAQPAEMIRAIEELARGDGATAWCAMIASTSSLLGAYLPEQDARLIYADGRGVTGGVFAPRGRAERLDEGYMVSGRWSFVSGVRHCDWVMGGCIVHSGERPELLENGSPDVRLMLMPIDSVEVIDTWSVSGLRGTGSHDMSVVQEPVPTARGVSLFSDPPRHTGTLYSFPLFGLLAVGIASVALGIARGAIEELIVLAAGKTPAASLKTLAQRATVQADVARAEATLRSARALMLEEAEGAWAAAQSGAPMSDEHKLGLRLAATHATGAAAEVVTAMYHAGGGSSIYDSSPLQRRLRDVHVATQHMMVAPATWELTGRLLLGLPTDTVQL